VVPDTYKLGSICPVLKKGKPSKQPGSYRRITISSIIGKIVEVYAIEVARDSLNNAQSRFQYGFTKHISPIYAAVLLTEIAGQAKDNGEDLVMLFMDTSKAFDVVDHKCLLNSLYMQGVRGKLWKIFESLYSNIRATVKWDGSLSSEFCEKQGIRQGGSSSADLYKAGKNRLLQDLSSLSDSFIGPTPVNAVMVADDLLLLGKNHSDLRCLLAIAEADANKERYKFSETKTKIVSTTKKTDCELYLNGKVLEHSQGEPHLGIIRNSNKTNTDTIQKRIKDARRSLYSLLGAGFVGLNGVGPEISILAYKTYIIPILLYGLESLVLEDKDIKELSKFHKMVLRRFLHFPESTAIPALYLMTGCPPVEALIHIRVATLIRSIILPEEETPPAICMRNLIVRQMACKDEHTNSWAKYAQSLLHKYNLSVISIMEQTPSKMVWKQTVKKAVLSHWKEKLVNDANEMCSLEYFDYESCDLVNPSSLWTNLETPLDVRKSTIKAKLVVSRYPLGASHIGGNKPVCQLCNDGPEDTSHFLLQCKATTLDRRPYLNRVLELCRSAMESIETDNIVKLILGRQNRAPFCGKEFETLSRNMIFKLHNRRSILLGGRTQYSAVKT